ncbi:YbaB/EbfC DNA-binding family protein [Nonomuraea maritima]|uniref:YbaB/EbfC DNA-binding family protein n=1 Tax=Nonomuraea maritima TaxID=683260 RepID=A0A1G9A9N4_9ACTN|nr:YbaB/EbfC family nucleoid-associated protein [Nonomuraea maritima]SDK24076.1 YbaB/EbfC DNA-binding family protein [Nonomuraea maritima]
MIERELGGLDLDRILRNADAQMARSVELQKTLAELVGRAEDEDGLVTVEFGGTGLKDLRLHPKAMRLPSGELAARIKEVLEEASADLRRQVSEAMEETFGEDNPMRFAHDPDGMEQQARAAAAAYDRTFEDVMGHLDRLHTRLTS